jgi:hypothetical protein
MRSNSQHAMMELHLQKELFNSIPRPPHCACEVYKVICDEHTESDEMAALMQR